MKLFITSICLSLVSLLVADGSTVASEEIEQEGVHSEIKTEISQQWNEFFDAWKNGDAKTSASFFTENGMHFRPGAAIDTGKGRIEEVFSMILSKSNVEYCTQETLEINVFGDTIIEYGVYEQKWLESPEIMNGGYFAVWKRTEQKSIKLHRLIFN